MGEAWKCAGSNYALLYALVASRFQKAQATIPSEQWPTPLD
jgi:hypothetical protein